LGTYAGASSVIPAPSGINYLDVQLEAGEREIRRIGGELAAAGIIR
jgi:hypothetical protein